MSENLTFEGSICHVDRLTFEHLRAIEVGKCVVFRFADGYTALKARNLANTFRHYYGNATFSVNQMEDGTIKITRKS